MKPYYSHAGITIYHGDCREILPQLHGPVMCCVTSPPYWGLRDYGHKDQIGLEAVPCLYQYQLQVVFGEVWRILHEEGTLWLNLGDCYAAHPGQRKIGDNTGWKQETNEGSNTVGSRSVAGLKAKNLVGIPWRVAFALQADGWYLRSDIVWNKPNPMPESVTDRPTRSHEFIFLMAKSESYYCNMDAIREPFADERMGNPGAYARTTSAAKGANNDRQDKGFLNGGNGWNTDRCATGRNKRDVWTVNPQPVPDAHFATFPPDLIKPCIIAGCPHGNTVLDPFAGAGTTLLVAQQNHCRAIGIEIEEKYCEIAAKRLSQEVFAFGKTDQGHSDIRQVPIPKLSP